MRPKKGHADNAEGGFTLIELTLTVAIIAVLGSILIPKFGDLIMKGKEAAVMNKLGAVRGAFNIWAADIGEPPDTQVGLVPKYISRMPEAHIPAVPEQNNPGHEPGTGIMTTTSLEGGIMWVRAMGGHWMDCQDFKPAPWKYVTDGPYAGEVYVFCDHNRSNGQPWFTGQKHPFSFMNCMPL